MKDTRISITRQDLESAAREGSMSPLDVEPLWTALNKSFAASQPPLASSSSAANPDGASRSAQSTNGGAFDLAQLAWYAGGALVMIAMGYFMALAQDSYGTGATFALSILYATGFGLLGDRLLKQGARIPAGVLFTIAVLLVPLALDTGFSVFHLFTLAHFEARTLTIELLTAAVAIVTLLRVRTPLLTATVYGSFWLVSITAAWILSSAGSDGQGLFGELFGGWYHYNLISMVSGLVLLLSAIVVDSKFGRSADYSWWGYFFGTAAFWIPLSLMDSGGEFGKLVYFLINVLLMVSSVVLARRVFLLAGAIGAIYYVGHLLGTFLANSFALPVALIVLGIGIIYLGIQYRKHQAGIEGFILSRVPAGLRRVLPKRA